jgi:hypothetical protein
MPWIRAILGVILSATRGVAGSTLDCCSRPEDQTAPSLLASSGLARNDLPGDPQDIRGWIVFGALRRAADAIQDRTLLRVEDGERHAVWRADQQSRTLPDRQCFDLLQALSSDDLIGKEDQGLAG